MAQDRDFFSPSTAITLVVANMIGTGVFTSLGFQLLDIRSAPIILALWLIGGIVALCGALCYAELGAALPRSGGEYNFLSRIYHPGAGFVSGWVSVTVGFSAPTAAAAITAATYFQSVFPDVAIMPLGITLVALIGILHFGGRRGSANFQQLFTTIKILLILVFIGAACWQVDEFQNVRWMPEIKDASLVGTGAFAVALIYVNYAYTGWNAATYLSGEVKDPSQKLPKILILGTAFVTVLYLLLHIMFLAVAPMSAMAGKVEVGFVVAGFAFGESGAKAVGIMLSVLLISTVSAMLLAGPRALQVMGQDFRLFAWLAKENKSGVPAIAVGLQLAITLAFILTSSFESIIIFSGTILALNSLLTVLGVLVLRVREPDLPRPFRIPWYPLPLIAYSVIVSWTLVYLVIERPEEVLWALILIGSGLLLYIISAKLQPTQRS